MKPLEYRYRMHPACRNGRHQYRLATASGKITPDWKVYTYSYVCSRCDHRNTVVTNRPLGKKEIGA